MSLPIIIPRESMTPQVFPADTDYARFKAMLSKEESREPKFFELPSGSMQRYAEIIVMTGSAFNPQDVLGTCFCFDAVTGEFVHVSAYD